MVKVMRLMGVMSVMLFLQACFLLGSEVTVTFDANGGEPLPTQTFTIGLNETLDLYLPVPVRDGHTFVGWFAGAEGRDEVNVSNAVQGNLSVYARWEINSYNLSVNFSQPVLLNPFETELADSLTFTVEFDDLIPLEALELTGYQFEGLYWDEALTQRVLTDRMPSADREVYARITPREYTLLIDPNNGDAPIRLNVLFNEPIELPTVTREEATFVAWQLAANQGDFDLTLMPADNVSVEAVWDVNEFPITYHLDGGRHRSEETTQLPFGELIDLVPPIKEGHTFEGWYTEASFASSSALALDGLNRFNRMPNEAVDLYAQWSINEYTLSVFAEQEVFFLSASLAWNRGAYLSTFNEAYGIGELPNGTFNRLQPITHRFNLAEGEFIVQLMTNDQGLFALTNEGRVRYWGFDNFQNALNTLPVIDGMYAKHGTVFMWNTDGQVFIMGSNQSFLVAGEEDSGRFFNSPVDVSSVFDFNEDEVIIDIFSSWEHALALTNQGRVFAWGNNRHGETTGEEPYNSQPVNVTSLLNLAQGETVVDISVSQMGSFALTSESRVLYWGTRDYLSVKMLGNDHHRSPIDITVHFDLELGDHIVKILLGHYNAMALTAQNRVLTWGANWEGDLGTGNTDWNDRANDITARIDLVAGDRIVDGFIFEGSSILISEQGRLYVFGRNENSRTITNRARLLKPTAVSFIDFGIIEQRDITFDEALALVTPSATEGFEFIGYYTDANYTTLADLQTMPARDLRLYVNFEPREQTLTLSTLEGVTPTTVSVRFNQVLDLETPVREGFTFMGWYEDAELSSRFVDSNMPARDLTLYAAWEPITFTVNYYLNQFMTYRDMAANEDSALILTQSYDVILFGLSYDSLLNPGRNITSALNLNANEFVIAVYPAYRGFFMMTNQGRFLGFGENNNGEQFGRQSQWEYPSLTVLDVTQHLNLNEGETIAQYQNAHGSIGILTSEGRYIKWGHPHHTTFYNSSDWRLMNPIFDLAEDDRIVSISYGVHTLVLTEKGRLFAWGYNWNGNLGIGGTNDRSNPIEVTALITDLFDGRIIKAVASEQASFVLTDQGTLYYAGWFYDSARRFTEFPFDLELNAQESIMDVIVAQDTLIILTSQGRILASGSQNKAVLSSYVSENTWFMEPTDITADFALSSGETIRKISLHRNANFALVLTSSSELAFIGDASWFAQLDFVSGFGPFTPQYMQLKGWNLVETFTFDYNETWQPLPFGAISSNVTQWSSSTALNDTVTGSFVNVNQNIYGLLELTDVTLSFETNGGQAIASVESLANEIINIPTPQKEGHRFAGWFVDEALTQSFGSRRMPNEDTTLYAGWIPIDFTIRYYAYEDLEVKHVVVGEQATLIVTEDNRVIAFGQALFAGDYNGSRDVTAELDLKPFETVVSLINRYKTFLLITSDGRLLGLGETHDGITLSPTNNWTNGNMVERPVDLTPRLDLEPGEKVTRAILGWNHVIVLTNQGRLLGWGYNQSNLLLSSNADNWVNAPTLMNARFSLNAGETIVDLAGSDHVVVLTSQGRVFTWGEGNEGQLGNNTTTRQNNPTVLPAARFSLTSGDIITRVFAEVNVTYVLTQNSRVFVFGSQYSPKIGTEVSSHVQVPLDLSDSFALGENESIVNIVLRPGGAIFFSSEGRIWYSGDQFNQYRQSIIEVADQLPLDAASGEIVTAFSMHWGNRIYVTNLGRVFVHGQSQSGQLGDLGAAGSPTLRTLSAYTLISTETVAFDSLLSLREVNSVWLDVESINDLDIALPIELTRMPGRNLMLFESLNPSHQSTPTQD